MRTAVVLLVGLSAGLLAVAPTPAGSASPAGRSFGTTLDGDMWVCAIDVPDDTVEIEVAATPSIRIYYDGDTTVENVSVKLKIGENDYDETVVVDEVVPNETTTVEFEDDWEPGSPGLVIARCSVQVDDQNNGDNALNKDVFVHAWADFAIESIVAPPETVFAGEDESLGVVIKADADNNELVEPQVYVKVKNANGDSVYGDAMDVDLVPGQADTFWFDNDWEDVDTGHYTVSFALTPDDTTYNDTISEAVLSRQWFDVAVLSIAAPADTDTFDLYEDVSPVVSVVARHTPVDPVSVSLRLRIGKYYDTVETFELDRGETTEVEFDKDWSARPGDGPVYDSCWLVDPDSTPGSSDTVRSHTHVARPKPGWEQQDDMPDEMDLLPQDSGFAVSAGSWLCADTAGGRVMAAKGNKTPEFYVYNPGEDGWDDTRHPLPYSPRKGFKKGARAACDQSGEYLYASKGLSYDFWRYAIDADAWQPLSQVPAIKKLKDGTDMVHVTIGDTGFVYLVVGGSKYREFWRYDTAYKPRLWRSLNPVPTGTRILGCQAGTFLVYDGDSMIYCHESKGQSFSAYNVLTNSWTRTGLAPMPKTSRYGGKKASKEGSSGIWYNGAIWALKGNKTREFWRYDTAANSWLEQDTIGLGDDDKPVGKGGDLALLEDGIYALKGNKTLEFWRYQPPVGSDEGGSWKLAGGRRRHVHRPDLPALATLPPGGKDPGSDTEYVAVVDSSVSDLDECRVCWLGCDDSIVFNWEDNEGTVQAYMATRQGGDTALTESYDGDVLWPTVHGETLLFVCCDDSGIAQLWKCRAGEYDFVSITTGGSDKSYPSWLGNVILMQMEDSVAAMVCRVASDGSDFRALTSPASGRAEMPCFTSTGSILYQLTSRGDSASIWRMDTAGNNKAFVATGRAPCASPTSETCAYIKATQNGEAIYKRAISGGAETQLVPASNEEYSGLVFSPDGRYVIFAANNNSGGRILEVPLAGGTPESLAKRDGERQPPSVSPSGRWVACQTEDTTAEGNIELRYTRRYLGDSISAFSLDKSAMDATEDSLRIDFSLEGDAQVTLRVDSAGTTIRTIFSGQKAPGDYTYYWNGRKTSGTLALPGNYYVAVYASAQGWSDTDSASIHVNGTQVSGDQYGTWTTSGSPYVLTGDVAVPSAATLTINPGVKVMPSGLYRILEVHNSKLIAKGTSGSRIRFTPYRKLVPVPDSAFHGAWKGINVWGENAACTLNYCVVEYGGDVSHGMVNAHWRDVSITNSVLRGANVWGVNVDDDARDYVQIANDSFMGNQVGLNQWKLSRLGPLTQSCWFSGNYAQYLDVVVGTDDVASNTCWYCCGPGMEFHLSGDLSVKSAAGTCTLRIMPGLTVQMEQADKITVGSSTSDNGVLLALGRPGNGWITFKGSGWAGIRVPEDDGYQSRLRYCKITGVSGGSARKGLDVDGGNVVVERCSIFGNHDPADHDSRGIWVTSGGQVSVRQTYFSDNDIGFESGLYETGSASVVRCQFAGNDTGLLVSNDLLPSVDSSNFADTLCRGLSNLEGTGLAAAPYCWWGRAGGPLAIETLRVNCTPISTSPNVIIPSIDVAVRRPISPIDSMVSDTTVTLSVTGYVKNYYDDSLWNVPVTMAIGSGYLQTMLVTVSGSESCQVSFPACQLDAGTYIVRMSLSCVGDSNQSNDTIYDTLVIRHSIDAAALEVIQPGSQITVDDSIAPTALIANYSDSTRTVPVKFYLDAVLRESIGVSVGPHETTEAVFSTRTFTPDTHEVRFICCLPTDDNRHNDTVSASVYVKPGDYWVAQDSPPYATARLCWDKGQYLYAAERAGSGVRRFNTLANDWGAVSSPAVETVFGITSLKGQVYVLGNASSWGADEARSQKLDARAQNEDARQVKVQDANIKMQNAAQSGTIQQAGEGRRQSAEAGMQNADPNDDKPNSISQELTVNPQNDVRPIEPQDANREKHGGAFSNALGIYRYVAAGDSWVLVTTCDTTVVPHSGANLVADDAGSIYLIEGGTPRVLRYIVAADSWVTDTASFVISRWGAAAWSRGKLYVLADPLRVLELDPATGQWSTISLTSPDSSYGTALCADPVMDRLFAFCARPPGVGTQVPPFREMALRAEVVEWSVRAGGVEDTTGATLCFGSTQAYCLDGYGGFWRYRPTPQFDAAAVATAIPDTIPLDSLIVPAGIVQNTWQDTLPFSVHMTIGSYSSSRTDTVPPQQWDTVAFDSTSFSPGTYPITLTVSLGGEAYRYNDTATGSLFVRYRTDAQALAVESPAGRIPYDSLIRPEGRIGSNSDETLDVWAKMTLGSSYTDSVLVTLPPFDESTVTFDTCHLRVGVNTALLRVRCDGDEVPGNDEESTSVQIVAGDYWKVLAQCPDNEVRLVGRPGSAIYSVKRSGTSFRYYDPAQDTWVSKANSSLSTNLSLCRQGNKIYALGTLALGMDEASSPGLGREPESSAGFGNSPRNDWAQTGVAPANGLRNRGGGRTDAGPAVVRYHINSNSWFTVSTQLPFSIGNGSCVFMTCDSTLFVLGSGSVLWRYCINHQVWDQRTSMPGSVCAWTSGAYDNAGHFYVLADSSGKLREYNVAGNSWDSLTPLNRSTPTGSALCSDSARSLLYALWADTSPGAYCYDIAGDEWTEVESFPSSLTLPALAQRGDNPYGQNGSTFAEYFPEPELDVAALEILAPGDTERYDSAVVPTGVVHNLSEVPVWCQLTITLGDTVRVVPSLYLESDQTDTVAFDSTYLPAGRITATLHVTCTGDENPGNDTCSKPVQVDAPWEPRNQTNYAQGRLDADTGVAVYFAPGSSAGLQKYVVSGDTWSGMLAPPFAANCLDLAYYNGALYALGLVGTDGASKGRRLSEDAGPNLTSHPAIYRYALGDTIWTLVSDSLPLMMVAAGRWIAATGPGIYLEPGYGRAFYRYATGTGWTTRDSLPVSVTSPVALDWDRDDEIFLLGSVSAESSAFLGYSISGDSWVTLTTTPVQPQAGVAIAAEPDGNTVLALMPADTSPALLYGYDRTQDTWTLLTSPTWTACTGAAMTWAGTEAYALTGHMLTGPGGSSSFWCYDPGFAAYWGRGLEGVAGKALPLLRWQLTCAPNPLSARAVIRWQVPRLSSVSLKVYNTAGQMVRVLSQGRAKPGSYTATWNGCDQQGRRLAAGVYVCALDGPGARITRKVVLTE